MEHMVPTFFEGAESIPSPAQVVFYAVLAAVFGDHCICCSFETTNYGLKLEHNCSIVASSDLWRIGRSSVEREREAQA